MAPQDIPAREWPAQAADAVERVVGTIRDRATGPVLTIIRGLVFGLVAAVLALVALVIVAIVAIRVLALIPGGVWVAYLIAGGLFLLPGFWLWSRRKARPA